MLPSPLHNIRDDIHFYMLPGGSFVCLFAYKYFTAAFVK
jgi:hypothetical protein